MISAGEIGAIFSIKNEAAPVLRALIDQIESLVDDHRQDQGRAGGTEVPPGSTRSVGGLERRAHRRRHVG